MDRPQVRVATSAEPRAAVVHGTPLTLGMAGRIAPALARRMAGWGEATPADLSFANLWLFRRAHDYRLHEGDWPCISGHTYDGHRHAIPLFGLDQAPASVLAQLSAQHGCLYPLSEQEAAQVRAWGLHLSSQRDDADYLYPAVQFASYAGRVLQKKRNLMAQLLTAHTVTAQPYTPALQTQALQVLQAWLADKGKASGDADDLPCREALALAPELGLSGFVYQADGQAAGFLLAEALQPGVWVIRFAKALVRYKGMAQFMFHHFAGAAPQPAHWLNFEQDLGLPNFRRTKQSYQPSRLVAKWRASHLPQDPPAPRP